jgi:hypothetical protein
LSHSLVMKQDPKYLRCFLCLYFLAYYEAFGLISMFMTACFSIVLTDSDELNPRSHATSFGEADNCCRSKVLFLFGLWNNKIVVTNPILDMNMCSLCVFELYLFGRGLAIGRSLVQGIIQNAHKDYSRTWKIRSFNRHWPICIHPPHIKSKELTILASSCIF